MQVDHFQNTSEPPPHRPGGRNRAKRVFDIVLSFLGLLVLSPVLLLISVLSKLSAGGPVFFRQTRIGLGGRPFVIWKFRTMVPNADQLGALVTQAQDARVTPLGKILRQTKLDELPQLWNVLKGEMSLVGPRPEVPSYMDQYTPYQRRVLEYKPGITDAATLYFRNEEALLRKVPDVESFYLRHCVPRKVHVNLEYAARAGLVSDTWIILQTVCPYWLGVLSVYALMLATAFCAACLLGHNFLFPGNFWPTCGAQMVTVVTLQLACLSWRKHCHGLLSYFSLTEMLHIALACGIASTFLILLRMGISGHWLPSWNVMVIDLILAPLLLGSFRLFLRLWREHSGGLRAKQAHRPARIAIIGAGGFGTQLARELNGRKQLNRTVVAFFDDAFHKWRKRIHNIPVIGMPECLLGEWRETLDEVVVAMPEASPERLQQIYQLLRETQLNYCTAPNVAELGKPGSNAALSGP